MDLRDVMEWYMSLIMIDSTYPALQVRVFNVTQCKSMVKKCSTFVSGVIVLEI